MSKTQAAMVALLKKHEWKFQIQDETHIGIGLKGNNGTYNGWFILEDHRIALYFSAPFFVPEERRDEMGEFITRANFGLFVGNFEMDYADGELRYKTAMPWLSETPPPEQLLDMLIGVNLQTMDRYFPGVNAVVYADADPEAAVKKVESMPGQQG